MLVVLIKPAASLLVLMLDAFRVETLKLDAAILRAAIELKFWMMPLADPPSNTGLLPIPRY